MRADQEQLKHFLLDSKLVTVPDLLTAEKQAAESGQTLGAILMNEGKISEDDFRRLNAYVLGIPFVDLKEQKIDRAILALIPEPIARKHNIVAYHRDGDNLEVAMLDPEDLEAIEFIKKQSGLKILPRLSDIESIRHVLVQYQKSLKAEFGDIIQKESLEVRPLLDGEGEDRAESDLKKLAEDLPIVRIIDTLLSHAISQKASDIHIETYEKEVVVRYRIDGLLHDAMVLPKNVSAGLIARIKVLASLRLDEKRLPQDGRFKIETNGQNVTFRVSILPTFFGEKIVMRLLPDSVTGFTLESGGFYGADLERLHEAIRQTTGMVLVTGPTGSGKSTTLYTLLEILNTPDVNISTIEDPIEYQIPRVNQTQVKPEIGLTFGSGLRALVRQDPDIVMVGEIRDHETVELAINASLTGHLVLSTLHTNSAAGTIPRLLDMGAEAFLLVSTIKVIVGQRLVRRLAKSASRYQLSKAELEKLGHHADLERVLNLLREEKIIEPSTGWEAVSFFRPTPGEESKDGYAGRIGIHEVLKMTPPIKDLIIAGSTAEQIETEAKKEGMTTMIEDGIFKAARGITSLEEVLRVVTE